MSDGKIVFHSTKHSEDETEETESSFKSGISFIQRETSTETTDTEDTAATKASSTLLYSDGTARYGVNTEETTSAFADKNVVAILHENGMHEYVNEDLGDCAEEDTDANSISIISSNEEAAASEAADSSNTQKASTAGGDALINVELEPGQKVTLVSIKRRTDNKDSEGEQNGN